jgi:restriction system protein
MIPSYQTLMLPVLKSCSEGEISTSNVVNKLADEFQLTQEQREQLLPSGKQTTFSNRVQWAKSYLKQAGLLKYPARGNFVITEAGSKVLASNPETIDNKLLMQFYAFREFRSRKGIQSANNSCAEQSSLYRQDATPDELLRSAYKTINDALAADLLDRVREASTRFFEELMVNLLIGMGYGGSHEGAGRALGKSGDNGVDGVIDQDPLGIDQIYVQAKRYAEGNNVSASAIRDFFGALNLKQATKGIFITASDFTAQAVQTAKELAIRIVLINGKELAKLMVRYNIGCRNEDTLYIKKIDEDFFFDQ